MFPSPTRLSNTPPTETPQVNRFADPHFRAAVRDEARKLKEISTPPRDGLLKACDLQGLVRTLRSEWGEAAKLGFRLGTHALERFQRQFDDHDARDAVAVGTVMLTAFGLTESLARAMNESLPAVERLNCEWSPPDCEYGLRLAGGKSFV